MLLFIVLYAYIFKEGLEKFSTDFICFIGFFEFMAHFISLILMIKPYLSLLTVDVDMLTYMYENSCTDGPLARGIQKILETLSPESEYIYYALYSVIISMITTIIHYLVGNRKVRAYFSQACKKKD
jgi:hypothetical protein